MRIHLANDSLVSTVIILGDEQHGFLHPSTGDGMKSVASDQILQLQAE